MAHRDTIGACRTADMRLSDTIVMQQIDHPDGTFTYALVSEHDGGEIELNTLELGRLMTACMYFQVHDAQLSQHYRIALDQLYGQGSHAGNPPLM